MFHALSAGVRRELWEAYRLFVAAFRQTVEEATVRSYIERQEAHHRRTTFKDELLTLLRKHNVEFDPPMSLIEGPYRKAPPFGAEWEVGGPPAWR